MTLLLTALLMQALDYTRDTLDAVKAALEKKEALLVDVREVPEWESGHLQAAASLPLGELRKASAEDLEKRLPKKGIVYLHCRSGKRSLTAGQLLKAQGYDVRPLRQGFEELLRAGFAEAPK